MRAVVGDTMQMLAFELSGQACNKATPISFVYEAALTAWRREQGPRRTGVLRGIAKVTH